MNAARAPAPVCLRRVLDPHELSQRDPCDLSVALGSFWPNSRTSFESHVIKGFKECCPASRFEPQISALCEFYAELVLRALDGRRIGAVARVLSAAEKQPEHDRPQSLLVRRLCCRAGAEDITGVFFKSESRPAMRLVPRLAGPGALKARIDYVLQDLFVRPCSVGGTILLIDDICNLGASMTVYASALKRFAGAQRVLCVNLAATRFAGGRDGRGMLKLELAGLRGRPGLEQAWLDSASVWHTVRECPFVNPPGSPEMRFLAERNAAPCPRCASPGKPERRWWRTWG